MFFGRKYLGYEEAILNLRALDDIMANDPESISILVSKRRSSTQSIMREQLHRRESMISQKSRCILLIVDGRNSKFFHSFLKARQRRNNISPLRI